MARIHVTRRLPARVEDELAASFELVPAAEGVDGLLVNPGDRVDAALLDRVGPSLRVVANFGVGYDNVDVAAATERGVVVANTPDVLTEATAEMTIALLLALLRRVAEGDRLVRRRDPWRLDPTFMLGRGLRGLRLGIVGVGRIGREVARLAEAHGMEVVPGRARRARPARRGRRRHAPRAAAPGDAAPGRLGRAGAPASGGGARQHLARPGRGRGRARGGARGGTAGGCGAGRPRARAGGAPRLLGREDVVLTPHLGSATHEAREAMGMLCVEALRAVLLEDRLPRHALNPQAVR